MVGEEEKMTTIALPESIKDKLHNLKIHPREPFWEVIERLLKGKKK